MERISIDGVNIYPFSSTEQLIKYIDNHKVMLVAVNAEKILHANDLSRELINNNIGYCDGIFSVLALKKKGVKDVVKIPGCELWLEIVEHFHNSKSFYLVGAKQEVIDATVSRLKDEYMGLNIVGYRNGYLNTEEEKKALIDDIAEKKPDVVFVAMGSPKQELLMSEMQQRHKAIYQGLGGSFDVYTGNVKRAPKWWVDHKVEFAYRLFKEPRRIKRQLPLVKMAIKLLFKKI
ncbi:MAG: WecB/TagA/CpsF family glycosyltransferase [Muribaculaceae bacterium]|nr:WecB/TagA/CpsF family glycosyltransferase [Muribaculaceae bacterium]